MDESGKDMLFSNKEAMYVMAEFQDSVMANNGIKYTSISPFDITKKHFAFVEKSLLKFAAAAQSSVMDDSDEIGNNNSVGMIQNIRKVNDFKSIQEITSQWLSNET